MLQGSLDNFALDEVLGLLSSTSKTGQLDIKGDRGSGSLLFNEGNLIGAASSYTANGTGIEDVMFELLRYEEGSFSFTSKAVETTDQSENVAAVLSAAEHRLADWREIESVVPTLEHMVGPAPDLPDEEVTINRAEWAVLTVIAAGCPASTVCERLNVGEVEGSRQIKNLAERLLVTVGPPRASGVPSSMSRSSAPAPRRAAPTMSGARSSGGGGLDHLLGDAPAESMPPSPAEIDEFTDGLDNAAELTDEMGDNSASGLLMKYLQTENQ